MPDFTIRCISVPENTKGVYLEFSSAKEQTLIIKNIRFCFDHSTEDLTVIYSVILRGKDSSRFFEFPQQDIPYETMKFQVKQVDENGWDVCVDIGGKKITIEKSTYKII